jgi:DNA-directed RNA polymerase specialized sigma24 family protein
VRRLPDKQRPAVFLRFAADLYYPHIGAALQCSEPAARQNVRAGLATIRRGWARG